MSRPLATIALAVCIVVAVSGCTQSEFRLEPGSLPDANVGVPYDFRIRTEGLDMDASIQLSEGSVLPQGMFVEAGKRSLRLLGTPAEAGVFTIRVEAVSKSLRVTGKEYQLRVRNALVITTADLGPGAVGVSFSEQVTAVGGSGQDYVWSLVSGALPYGLTLTGGTPSADIAGQPQLGGRYAFSVQVTDSQMNTAVQALEIQVSGPLDIAFPLPVSNPVANQPYLLTLTADGLAPHTWYIENGELPPGLSLGSTDPYTGEVSGTPTTPGRYYFEVRARDALSSIGVAAFDLMVQESLTIVNTNLADARVNEGYTHVFSATGGAGNPHLWRVISGALPPGLSLNSAGTGNPLGTISGIPTLHGVYSFTVEVSDGGTGIASHQCTVNVLPGALRITTTSLPSGPPNEPYTATIEGSDGTGAGYAWAVIAGTLPAGLSLAPSGTPSTTITGTPTQTGTFNVTIELTDSQSNVAARAFDLTIHPPGTLLHVAGTGSTGPYGDGGQATAATLHHPQGIALDGGGNIVIADTQNHRIRRVDATTGIITTIAGTGSPGYTGDSGPATAAKLNGPSGIDIDAAGNIYFADSYNHVVRRVSTTGTISTIAGIGTPGYSGNGAAAVSAALHYPYDVCVAGNGDIYIADTENHAVRRIAAATGNIETFAGDATATYGGDNGPASQAGVRLPSAVEIDSAGNVIIGQTYYYLRRVDTSGTITTIAGLPGGGSGGDGGPAAAARMSFVAFLTIDAADNIYVSDSGRIRKITATTGMIDTVASTGLSFPQGLWSHTNGDLYIADRPASKIFRMLSP